MSLTDQQRMIVNELAGRVNLTPQQRMVVEELQRRDKAGIRQETQPDVGEGNRLRPLGPPGGRGMVPSLVRGMARIGGAVTHGRRVAEQAIPRPEDPTFGEKVGAFVGEAAPIAAIPGASSLAGAAAIGGGVAAAESRGDPVSTVIGAAGGLLGNVAGRVIGRVVSPITSRTGQQIQGAYTRGIKRLGLQTTAGQRTQSRGALGLERGMARRPMSRAPFERLDDHNQEVLNNAARRSLGLTNETGKLTPEDLSTANFNTSLLFDNATRGEVINLDAAFVNKIATIRDGWIRRWGNKAKAADIDSIVADMVEDIRATGGKLPGEVYQKQRSRLGTLAQTHSTTKQGDRELGKAFKELQDLLDSAAEKSLPIEKAGQLRQARSQYARWLQLKRKNTIKEGDVQAARLHSTLSEDPGYVRGERLDDLSIASRFHAENPRTSPKQRVSEIRPFDAVVGAVERSTGLAGAMTRPHGVMSRYISNTVVKEPGRKTLRAVGTGVGTEAALSMGR